jgi:putative DNA primase/helicase
VARDWDAFDAELRARVAELAEELLGAPSLRGRQEWRWGRRGSLSVMVGGARAGQWYDHERGEGGGFPSLVARELGTDRAGALDWLDRRIGTLPAPRPSPKRKAAPPRPQPQGSTASTDATLDAPATRAERSRNAAVAIWGLAQPAIPEHPYLRAKGVAPHELRQTGAGQLVVPLADLDGAIHTLQFIADDGRRRGMICVSGWPLDG